MKLLGIDSSTHTAGIAVVETRGDSQIVLGEARREPSSRAADLLVAIDQVCRTAGVAPSALDAIAIGAGPGSFTGLRIGMATAKGIAFAAGRPLWAVSSLAALADDARRELAGDAEGAICAVLDARRGELFAGCFRGGVALGPERVLAPSALAPWVAELAGTEVVRFAGDALDAYREPLAALAPAWLAARTPSGRAVASLALAGAHVDITVGGAPVYIRLSEAEVMYPDGVPGAQRRR
jgi:tRNA threonylcarbamoyladenosine biosynthesis protein TsaB